MRLLLFLPLFLALLLPGCGGGGGSVASDSSALAFSTVATGSSSAFPQPTTLVIRSAQELAAVIPKLNQDGQLRQSGSDIDFANFMVLGIFLGTAANGCYSITVERVQLAASRIQVQYRVGTPGPNAICTLALTFPFHLVAVRRSDLPIDFARID